MYQYSQPKVTTIHIDRVTVIFFLLPVPVTTVKLNLILKIE